MKKLICLLLVIALLASLWACGTAEPMESETPGDSAPPETEPPTASTEPSSEVTEAPTEATEPSETEPQPDPEATANLEYPEIPETDDTETLLWALAERHLTKFFYAIYLYTEEDLTEHTVAELTQAQRDAISPYGEANIPNYPEFVTERARYDAFFRNYEKIYRKNFSLDFHHDALQFDGNWAVMKINAGFSYNYVDSTEPSGGVDVVNVYFYCYDGEWLIYDVIIEWDWNYATPEIRRDFDADTAIEDYIALREGAA